jgi:hypothetical protein
MDIPSSDADNLTKDVFLNYAFQSVSGVDIAYSQYRPEDAVLILGDFDRLLYSDMSTFETLATVANVGHLKHILSTQQLFYYLPGEEAIIPAEVTEGLLSIIVLPIPMEVATKETTPSVRHPPGVDPSFQSANSQVSAMGTSEPIRQLYAKSYEDLSVRSVATILYDTLGLKFWTTSRM